MLPTKDDSEISRIYGKIIRKSCEASTNFSGLPPQPLAVAQITAGAASTPMAVTMSSANISIPATCCTNSCVSAGDFFCRYSAKIGTKACENAPSAKIRRSRLGRRKATTNASIAMPAPKIRASTASRTKPSTRDSMVMLPIFANALRRFMLYYL